MWKNSSVVMLPTNKIAKIYTSDDMSYMDNNPTYINKPNGYHLYFTSNEIIKKGDWCICSVDKSIGRVIKILSHNKSKIKDIIIRNTTDDILSSENNFKKIIASTDLLLIKETSTMSADSFDQTVYTDKEYLPHPSKLFIEDYIINYNKDNIIKKILIDVDDNNNITIKKIKDSWNREEVIRLCNKAWLKMPNTSNMLEEFNDWIESNLCN